ncbi:three-helix bundle dimerization domain-containing protein [Mycolicibacterium sp.]|uniref:three-helix bundle dimerization domain-containing protein n=1 Tax=Mycolicibacterium sp. TaxID=2320850 RepID=UPI00355F1B31
MAKRTEEELLSDVERRLIDEFTQLPPTAVVAAVEQARDRFSGSKIRDFVPLLVERRAYADLSHAAI